MDTTVRSKYRRTGAVLSHPGPVLKLHHRPISQRHECIKGLIVVDIPPSDLPIQIASSKGIRRVRPDLKIIDDLRHQDTHLQPRQTLARTTTRPIRKRTERTFRQRNTLIRSRPLPCNPPLGAKLKRLGENVLIVAQAVQPHAHIHARREVRPVDRRAPLQDLAGRLGGDGRRHAQRFLDECVEVLAGVQRRAGFDLRAARECGKDLARELLLDLGAAGEVEEHRGEDDGCRVGSGNDQRFALTVELV